MGGKGSGVPIDWFLVSTYLSQVQDAAGRVDRSARWARHQAYNHNGPAMRKKLAVIERELKHALDQLALVNMEIGDGRNRAPAQGEDAPERLQATDEG